MKSVFCFTERPSSELVCYVNGVHTRFPENWKGGKIPREDKCETIDEIKNFIKETNAEFVLFGFRSNGIPNRAVKVSDTEKLNKAFKALERMLIRMEGYAL